VRAGAGRELAGGDRLAVGHRAPEAELVAEGGERGVERRAELRRDVVDEGLDAGLVDHGGGGHHAGRRQRS
jgi:hypothetical protein